MKAKIAHLLLYFALVDFAFCCSCLSTPPEIRRDQSRVVFVGRVMGLSEEKGVRRYDFQVTEILKGVPTEKITVSSSGPGSLCGSYFEKDTIYLIYAVGTVDRLSTNLCMMNRVAASPEGESEIKVLRRQR